MKGDIGMNGNQYIEYLGYYDEACGYKITPYAIVDEVYYKYGDMVIVKKEYDHCANCYEYSLVDAIGVVVGEIYAGIVKIIYPPELNKHKDLNFLNSDNSYNLAVELYKNCIAPYNPIVAELL